MHTHHLIIRPVKKEDIPDLFYALQDSAREQGLEERFSADEQMLFNSLFSEHTFAEAFLALLQDRMVGFILFSKTNRNFDLFKAPGLYVHQIYVANSFRRQQIGTKLVKKIKELASNKGYCRIDFLCLNSNEAGRHFYESLKQAKEIDYAKLMRISL